MNVDVVDNDVWASVQISYGNDANQIMNLDAVDNDVWAPEN